MNLLWRLLYRLQRMLSGLRHWVLRRFAPPGLALLGGLAITAMLGADTENTVAYQVFALLFCLLVQAFLFSWFVRLRFTATRTLPRFGTVGGRIVWDQANRRRMQQAMAAWQPR